MRKSLLLSLSFLATCFALNSCDPWEDDSYHEGGPGGSGNLLKEVHTTTNGAEGLATYTYDENGRLTGGYSYASILDMETYNQITQSYPSETTIHTVSQSYMSGTLISTSTIDSELNGDVINITMEMEAGEETMTSTSEITFSTPCGAQQNTTVVNMPGFPDPIESVSTYEYTDGNCSYIESVNGDVSQTVTMDDKFSPFTTPESIAMGITPHNPVKIENADGTIETITYTYNEDNYPVTATHTFNEESGQADYTEEFIYY
jgi:hypothetical protein